MNREEIVRWAASTESLLLASDFDGTLADIVLVPSDAAPVEGALDALDALARAPRVHLAIASGRTLAEIERKVPRPRPAWLVAEHGAWLARPGGAVRGPAAELLAEVDALGALAEAVTLEFPGAVVERKSSGLALHLRGVSTDLSSAAEQAAARWAEDARARGAEILFGRAVVEARLGGATKSSALAEVLGALPPGTLPLVGGDDRTDEGAIAWARAMGGAGVYIASTERPKPAVEPDLVLADPRAWVALLRDVAAARARIS